MGKGHGQKGARGKGGRARAREHSPSWSRAQEGQGEGSSSDWCQQRWTAELLVLRPREVLGRLAAASSAIYSSKNALSKYVGPTVKPTNNSVHSKQPPGWTQTWRTPRGFCSTRERGSAGNTCRDLNHRHQSMTSTTSCILFAVPSLYTSRPVL